MITGSERYTDWLRQTDIVNPELRQAMTTDISDSSAWTDLESSTTGPTNIWSFITWWYRPLIDEATWLAATYLFFGLLLATFHFTFVVTAISVNFSLLFIGIGFVLAPLLLRLTGVLASMERGRASWVGITIAEPRTAGTRIRAVLSDSVRWRQVSYFLTLPFVASVCLGAAGVAWYFTVALVVHPLSGVGPFGSFTVRGTAFAPLTIPISFVGIMLLGAPPRITLLAARAEAGWADLLLGRQRLREAEQRIETLTRSRDDVVDAVATERRRIERNLHDGVQQQLVALGIDLGMAEAKLPGDPDAAKMLLGLAQDKTRTAIGELRTIGRGLHPAILGDRGLDAALSAVVSGASVPITLAVQPGLDVPLDIAETAYFVANESVGNILKHAHATAASITVTADANALHLTVHDNGIGGATPGTGSGLIGIEARARAIDGRLDLISPPGGPTTLTVVLPFGGAHV